MKKRNEHSFLVFTGWSKALIVGLCLVIGVESVFLLLRFFNRHGGGFWNEGAPKYATVELRDDGFYPSEVTVRKGGTVTFTAQTGQSFWPASNLHPTHEIYPAFDPQKPLGPTESWSFTFEKEGRWSYHDHIRANRTGKIVVVGQGGDGEWSPARAASACVGEDTSRKQQCWDQKLESTLAERGLAAAFALFIELYKTEPSIAKGCHGWGHVLGKEAYHLFAAKKDFVIPNEASYCGYGFYHGFLTELLRITGDPSRAIAFCRHASTKADAQHAGNVYSNCVHGIGHGATAEAAENPANWGKVTAVLSAGKKACDFITKDPGELQVCWEGVFNEFQQNINSAIHGFSYDLINHDFFGICRAEEEKYKKACYFEFIGLIAQFTKRDFGKAAAMVLKDVSDHEDGAYLMVKMAADFMQDDIVHPTYDKNIVDCHALPSYLNTSCLDGLMVGFMAHGEPGQEYVKGLTFCRSVALTEAERTQCYQKFFSNFSVIYSSEKVARICESVETPYQGYCRR